ncbi:MAG: hypothetical protein ACO38I_05580 [Ilumatobacteraceae bacterium]
MISQSKEAAWKLSSHIDNKPREKWMMTQEDEIRAFTWMLTPDDLFKDMAIHDGRDSKLLQNHKNFVGSVPESTGGYPEGAPPVESDNFFFSAGNRRRSAAGGDRRRVAPLVADVAISSLVHFHKKAEVPRKETLPLPT